MKHNWIRILPLAALLVIALTVVACGGAGIGSSNAELLKSSKSIPIDTLVAEAKKEGGLTIIAVPRDWANYGEIIDTFTKKYGIPINDLNPTGSSAQEIEAIKANKDSKGPQAPDVVDIGFGFTESSKKDGLFAAYKVASWDSIPNELKDADGYWYGDYYGAMAFIVNKAIVKNVPQDWPDLLKPEYKGMVGTDGDPTQSSQAVNAVWAAGLSRTSGNLDTASDAGLQFWGELNKAGNYVPGKALAATIAQGAIPIAVKWDYLALADRDTLNGNPDVAVVIPKSFTIAGPYAQAISVYAPHPFAARLWMEFLYSDEGQLLWLKGYTHPVRYSDLVKNGKVPADLAAKLPPAELYANTKFPSLDQITAAKKTITENWRAKVLGQ